MQLLTFVFTPYSRTLLEKLTGFQLVKKFATFYRNRKYFTAFKVSLSMELTSYLNY
jgi:hypothetical protein